MKFLHLSLKALRLSLVRVGIGWMFALLAFNFNRISLVELGASGIIVTTLIGMHHFLSPFQVFWGRLADRASLFGYRRTPYILLGALVGSLVFLTLPSLAIALGSRELWAIPVAAVLFLLFGLAMAANGTATFALLGVFNVGALCMMMEMTVPGHTGLYMGIWGMAQGLGNGLASVLSGGLHTALIESHLLPPAQAYSLIFGLEGVIMVLAIVVLRGISTEQFKELDAPGLTAAVAFDATS